MKEFSPAEAEHLAPPFLRALLNRSWVRVTGLLCMFLVVCGVVTTRSFSERISEDIFFSLTLAGCLAVFVSVRPLREVLHVAALGLVFAGLQWTVLKVSLKLIPFVAILGLSSLLILLARKLLADEENLLLRDVIVAPLLLILLGWAGSGPLALTNRLHPATMDRFLYRMDQSFGVQMSFGVARVILSSRILARVAVGIYYILPVMTMLAYARQLVRDRNLAMTAFLAFVIVGPVGLVFYNFIPACGPVYLFGSDFPFRPMTMQQLRELPLELVAMGGMRNAFPSLHLAWALLIWWYSEGLSRCMKILTIAFLAGTVIATLGLGEHYVVDLVAAVPFALAIYAVSVLKTPIWNSWRLSGILVGLALTAGWGMLVRWGTNLAEASRVIPWSLAVITVGASAWLQMRLQKANHASLSLAKS